MADEQQETSQGEMEGELNNIFCLPIIMSFIANLSSTSVYIISISVSPFFTETARIEDMTFLHSLLVQHEKEERKKWGRPTLVSHTKRGKLIDGACFTFHVFF